MKFATRFSALMILVLALSAAGWGVRHFGLSKSMPAADSSVSSPDQLQLWFTQAPQEGSVTIRLVDSAGDLVETGDPTRNADDPKLMEVEVGQTLPDGAYTVAWRGIGDDGHVVRNEFGFRVSASH